MSMLIDPYRFGGGGWTPASLATPPSFWVDESTTATDAGAGACSQWNDRSGNAFHLTQATAGSRPLIVASGLDSKRTIRFDGSNDVMGAAGALSTAFRNVGAGWIAALYKKVTDDAAAVSRTVLHCSTPTATTVRAGMLASLSSGTPNAPVLAARRLDANGSAATAADTTDHNNDWIMVLHRFNWATGQGLNFVNGTQVASTAAIGTGDGATATSNTAAAAFNVGAASSTLNQSDIELAELLAGWGYLPTTDDIDRIFGYLAWKWGQEASLPGGHPYAGAPP